MYGKCFKQPQQMQFLEETLQFVSGVSLKLSRRGWRKKSTKKHEEDGKRAAYFR